MPVRVRLGDVDELFGQVTRAKYASGGKRNSARYSVIGKGTLAHPLGRFEVQIGGNTRNYFIYGEIQRKPGSFYKNVRELRNNISDGLEKVVCSRGLGIERSGNEFRLLLDEEPKYSVILGTNSIIIDNGKSHNIPNRITDSSVFRENLETYAEILGGTAEAFYERVNATLSLRPPILAEKYAPEPESSSGSSSEKICGTVLVTKPNTQFSEIAGCEQATQRIRNMVSSLNEPEIYRRWGTTPPKGLMLYGPPGTGKTLRVKALASEANATFICVKSSDIVGKWLGSTEKNMKELLDYANKNTPAILYFDEADQLGRRDEGTHQAIQRAVSLLLDQMDGIETRDGVLYVFSTNRPNLIDAALLSRISRKVEVPLPEEGDREKIFRIHAKKAQAHAKRQLFEKNLDYHRLAQSTNGKSGRDISEMVRETLERKAIEEIRTRIPPALVSTEEILDSIRGFELKTEEHYDVMFS